MCSLPPIQLEPRGVALEYARERMGEVLVRTGLISDADLDVALLEQSRIGGRLGDVLVRSRRITEDQIAQALAQQKGLEHVNLAVAPVDGTAANLLSARFLQRRSVIPIRIEGEKLVLAMSDPLDVESIDETEMLTGLHVVPVVATASQVDRAIEQYVVGIGVLNQLEADFATSAHVVEDLAAVREDAQVPVVRAIDQILREAVREGASDVHFEPDDSGVRVRVRVDGVLRQVTSLPLGSHAGLVSRIKIMGDMDIAERRRPQDGRITYKSPIGTVDLRVASIPTPLGEGIVIRILYRGIVVGSVDALGFLPRDRAVFDRILSKPYGALLIAGPTGSGKTTTLYTALTQINSEARKVVTIEDPVEYRVPGITQIAVNPRVGLSFAVGLRAVLRFDPDIVMVGEVRDSETASIAVRAALTGHYVLSSIHTNDAPSAVTRLSEMGIEPYVTSSSLLGVVAQRLVRTLCPVCKREAPVSPERLMALGLPESRAASTVTFEAVGCDQCRGIGYAGRTGVFEVLEMDEDFAALYVRNATAETLRAMALQKGMTTMRHHALELVAAGRTSLEEVNRVVV